MEVAMSKANKINKAIDWIAIGGTAYFVGIAIAGAIKRKRAQQGTSGIGAVKRSPRRIWAEVEQAQRHGIDFTDPNGWKEHTDVLEWMAHGKLRESDSAKPEEQRYFNQLRRAYNSIAGTNLPYKESIVRNENGDVILMYRDYELEKLPQKAAQWVLDTYNEPYALTMAAIATGTKFVWNSSKDRVHRGVQELIFGKSAPNERKQRISYIATPEKGGVYPEAFAHSIWEHFDMTGDTQEITDAVLEAIRYCTSVKGAQQMCIDEYMKAHQAEPDLLYQDIPF